MLGQRQFSVIFSIWVVSLELRNCQIVCLHQGLGRGIKSHSMTTFYTSVSKDGGRILLPLSVRPSVCTNLTWKLNIFPFPLLLNLYSYKVNICYEGIRVSETHIVFVWKLRSLCSSVSSVDDLKKRSLVRTPSLANILFKDWCWYRIHSSLTAVHCFDDCNTG